MVMWRFFFLAFLRNQGGLPLLFVRGEHGLAASMGWRPLFPAN